MPKKILQRRFPRPTEKSWVELASYAGVLLGIVLIAVVCYLEFFAPEPDPHEPPPDQAEEQAPEPVGPLLPDLSDIDTTLLAPGEEPAPDDEDKNIRRGTIERGDTAGGLLQEWLSAAELHAMVEACKNVYPLSRLRAGRPYTIFLENDAFLRFEYEIDNDNKLIVSKEGGKWSARKEEIHYDIVLAKVEGSIKSSFFQSMSDIGESAALAVRIAEIYAWEINFIRDIQTGDSFSILVEKRYRDGEFKGYGNIPVAEFINRSSKFEAYLYTDSFGTPSYFNAAGDSLKRAFLKAPLSFTRISSRFNLRRRHPIFKDVRPHPAVDYAAPSGTPVMAIGNGTVHYSGWGKGAGNYIVLKHPNNYESMYLHLKGFAKNLKRGSRVRQGEVIGYVGSTGYSTGPHLDFRMKQNGKFLNPEKVLSPRDESVPKNKLNDFKAHRETMRAYLSGEKPLSDWNKTESAETQNTDAGKRDDSESANAGKPAAGAAGAAAPDNK